MKQIKKTFFITVEGGEGVGKSYFLKHLSEAFEKQGLKHILTREPGGTSIAENLRALFNDPIAREESFTAQAEFLIISAARAQHVKNLIQPTLEKQNSVICDRFTDSSFVYQGFVGGLSKKFIKQVTDECTFGLEPDLTFLLDCHLDLAFERMKKRTNSPVDSSESTRYDQKERDFHLKVKEGFLTRAKENPERIKVINSSQSIDLMIEEALNFLKKKFPL